MLRLALLSLVALLMVAGCADCELAPMTAAWTDPALYGALEVQPRIPCGVTCQRERPAFNFTDAELDQRWGRYELYEVYRSEETHLYPFIKTSATAGRVSASAKTLDEFHAKRLEILAFLQNLTGRPAVELETTIDAMQTNRTAVNNTVGVYEFRAAVPFALRPARVFSNFSGEPELISHATLGEARLVEDGWTFVFRVPIKTLRGDGYELTVDASGSAWFDGLPMGAGQSEAYLDRIFGILRENHLPEPARDAVAVRGTIC